MGLIEELVDASLSFNTRRSYKQDLKSFIDWGGVLPASSQMVLEYLVDNCKRFNTRTLDRRLKTLRHWHRLHKFDDPTVAPEVVQIFKGIKRTEGKAPVRAAPLTKEQIIVIDEFLNARGRFIDLRDNAIIQVGFFGAFRRSELAGIHVEHLNFTDEGVEIFIPRSKTDQIANGAICLIPSFKSRPCPVRTLMLWLVKAGIDKGPVFRSFNGRLHTDLPIDPSHVNLIIKKIIKRCNLGNPDDYSGHSLRRGFATASTRSGATLEALMRHGRWRHASNVLSYIEEANRFTDNPAALLDR